MPYHKGALQPLLYKSYHEKLSLSKPYNKGALQPSKSYHEKVSLSKT